MDLRRDVNMNLCREEPEDEERAKPERRTEMKLLNRPRRNRRPACGTPYSALNDSFFTEEEDLYGRWRGVGSD